MGYVTSRLKTTKENAPSTVSLTGTVNSGGQGGTVGVQGTPSGPQQTKANYISGNEYLAANKEGAADLANRVVEPLVTETTGIKQGVTDNVNKTIADIGTVSNRNALIDRAATDARLLSEQEQTTVKDTLAGKYGGPTGIDFADTKAQQAKIAALTDMLGTSSGVQQQLGNVANADTRKYSTGMRNFDSMLLRQDPTIRNQLESTKALSGEIATAQQAGQEQVDAAVATAMSAVEGNKAYAGKTLTSAQTGQEKKWQTALTALQGRAGGINAAITGENPLSAQDLKLLGLTAAEYDKFRDAFVATSYGRTRALTSAENYNYNLSSPTQKTAMDANTMKANYWKNFQLDPFTVDQNAVGYDNVVQQDDLARYQALLGLTGAQKADFVPGTALANPEQNALYFNKAAASNALNAFMASGVKAPTSNLDYQKGTGTFAISGGGTPGTYVSGPKDSYVKSTLPTWGTTAGAPADGFTSRNPLTGGYDGTNFAYTGPTAGTFWKYGTKTNDPTSYTWDKSIDTAALAERAKRSGF